MKLLILDCNKFEYVLDHKTEVGEEVTENMKHAVYDNPTVIFCAIEAKDEEKIISESAKEIRRITRKNQSKKVILNPFAHLSSQLAQPEKAISLLNKLTEKLKECTDFETVRCEFGWYKKFMTDVKGHGNSQIFREY